MLRPFIIKLYTHPYLFVHAVVNPRVINVPVNQSLNDGMGIDGHLCVLELLLGITANGVGEVDSVPDLNVVRQRDVLDFNTSVSDVLSVLLYIRIHTTKSTHS